VTHPFHPLNGRPLVCVGERYNRYGKRLLLQSDDGQICSVPPQWTDVVVADPEVTLGGGRALLRFADLLDLAELVERLQAEHVRAKRKPNNTAEVNKTTPHKRDAIKNDPGVSPHIYGSKQKRKLDTRQSKRRK
jgi:hypothetical protein